MLSGKSTLGRQTLHVAGLHGGEHEAEAGNCGGEGVLVYAVDRFQGTGDENPLVGVTGLVLPGGEQAAERAEEEVAAAAGGVDHAQTARQVRVAVRRFGFQAELLDRGSRVYLRMNSSTNSGVCSRA